jgi:hypothetical protein
MSSQHPQNEDLPPILPKQMRSISDTYKMGKFWEEAQDKRRAWVVPIKPFKAPENDLFVEKLIPVAHSGIIQASVDLPEYHTYEDLSYQTW